MIHTDEWALEDAGLDEGPPRCKCGRCEFRNGLWWRGPGEADCLLTYVDRDRWNYCPHCGTPLPIAGF